MRLFNIAAYLYEKENITMQRQIFYIICVE